METLVTTTAEANDGMDKGSPPTTPAAAVATSGIGQESSPSTFETTITTTPMTTTARPTTTTTTTTTPSSVNNGNNSSAKCHRCQRRAAGKECPQTACLTCCTAAADDCPKHAAQRSKQAWRLQVLEGTTDVQQLAVAKRRALLRKSRFRETGFQYTGDTVVVWNVTDYYDNPKWREDARRRAKRRQQQAEDGIQDPTQVRQALKSSRKRFRKWVEDRHDKVPPPMLEPTTLS